MSIYIPQVIDKLKRCLNSVIEELKSKDSCTADSENIFRDSQNNCYVGSPVYSLPDEDRTQMLHYINNNTVNNNSTFSKEMVENDSITPYSVSKTVGQTLVNAADTISVSSGEQEKTKDNRATIFGNEVTDETPDLNLNHYKLKKDIQNNLRNTPAKGHKKDVSENVNKMNAGVEEELKEASADLVTSDEREKEHCLSQSILKNVTSVESPHNFNYSSCNTHSQFNIEMYNGPNEINQSFYKERNANLTDFTLNGIEKVYESHTDINEVETERSSNNHIENILCGQDMSEIDKEINNIMLHGRIATNNKRNDKTHSDTNAPDIDVSVAQTKKCFKVQNDFTAMLNSDKPNTSKHNVNKKKNLKKDNKIKLTKGKDDTLKTAKRNISNNTKGKKIVTFTRLTKIHKTSNQIVNGTPTTTSNPPRSSQKRIENNLSWIENINYVRKITIEEHIQDLRFSSDSFWDNCLLPENWDDGVFEQ